MAKSGTYNVQNIEDGKPAVQDTSYKSCLCIMLIFISFCALIILFSTIKFGNTDKPNNKEDTETFSKDRYHGKESEKLGSSTTYSKATTRRTTTTPQEPTSTTQKSPLSSQKPAPIPQEPTPTPQKQTPSTTIRIPTEPNKVTTILTITRNVSFTDKPTSTTQKSPLSSQKPTPTSQEPTPPPQQRSPSTTIHIPTEPNKVTTIPTTTPNVFITDNPMYHFEETNTTYTAITNATPLTTTASRVTTQTLTSTGDDMEKSTDTPTFHIEEPHTTYTAITNATPLTTTASRVTTQTPTSTGDDIETKNKTQVEIMQAKITSTPRQETPTTEYLLAKTTKHLVTTTPLLQKTTEPSRTSQTEKITQQPITISMNQSTSSTAAIKTVHITTTTSAKTTIVQTTTLIPENAAADEITVGTKETESTTRFLGKTTESKDDSTMSTQETTSIAGDNIEKTTEVTNKTQAATMKAKITSTHKQEAPTTVYLPATTTKQPVATTPVSQNTTEQSTFQTEKTTQQTVTITTNQPTSSSAPTSIEEVRIVNTTQKSITQQNTTTPSKTTIVQTTTLIPENTATDVPTVGSEDTKSTIRFMDTTTESKDESEGLSVTEQITTVKGDLMNKITVVQPEPTTTQPLQTKVSNSKNKPTSRFKSAVSRMLNLMDHSQDPCEDFYMYSCGGAGAARTPVENSADDVTWNSLLRQLNDVDTTDASDVPLAKLKTFHKSCIEHEATFNYKERLEQVKSILEDVKNRTKSNDPISVDDLTRLFAKMVSMKSLPFMEVNVGVDTNSTYPFELSPPYRSLTQDDVQRWSTLFKIDMHCLKHTKYDQRTPDINLNELYEQFTNCKKHYFSYLDSFNITTQAFDDLANIYGLMFSVDTEILNFTTSAYSMASLRDAKIANLPTIIKLSELNTKFKSINWELFFELISGHPHANDTKIHIYLKDALFNIFEKFSNMQPRDFYNYLYAIYANDIYQNVIIPKAIEHREDYCIKLSTYLFGDVFSYLYMKELPSDVIQTSKELVDKLFDELKNQLIHAIQGQDWLRGPKDDMVTKVNSLSYVFQEKDDSFISKDYLNKKYERLQLGDTFGANYVKMVAYHNEEKFRKAGKRFNETETFRNIARPFDRSPASLYSTPVVAIPYGMVRSWSLDYPSYFLMGKVGIKIAMEILRYFDPVGIRSFRLGDDADETYELLKGYKHSEKISKIYENKKFVLKISTESHYQNIRDNAALRLTYSVFNNLSSTSVQDLPFVKKDFEEEEVFLISVAQEFCENLTPLEYMLRVYEGLSLPNYWRVNKMVVTSKSFTDFYHCRPGGNLNPTDEEFYVFPDGMNTNVDQYDDGNEGIDYTGGL